MAFVVLRCSGLVSLTLGIVSLLAEAALVVDVLSRTRGVSPASALSAYMLPSLAGVVGGLAVFLLARPLSQLAIRDSERSPNNGIETDGEPS